MSTAAAMIAMFATDCFTAYAGGRWLEEWAHHRVGRTLIWTAVMEIVLGVNIGAFIELGWLVATPIATVAAVIGTGFAFLARRKPSDRA